jgi:PAS domain S-box-containing protein
METQLQAIRDKLINYALLGFVFFAIPAVAASVSRFTQIGWRWFYLIHIFILIALGLVFTFRSKLSIIFKTHFVSISFLLISFFGALTLGISGAYFFSIFSVIISTLIFGKRVGYIYFFISVIGLAFISFLHIFKIIDTKIDYNIYNFNITTWLTILTGLFLLSAIFIFAIGLFYDLFTKNIKDLIQKSKEQEIAQEKLKISEEKYRLLVNEVPVGIFQTSLAGKVLTANIPLAKMLGYNNPKAFVSAIYDTAQQVWFNPDERSEYVSLHEEHESIYDFKCQFKRKDNSIIWVSMNSNRVKDSEGKTLYFSGYIEDITERKLLEEQTKLFKDSIDVASDGAYWFDEGANLVYANKAGASMLGYSQSELLQLKIQDISFNTTPQKWREIWNFIKETGIYTNISTHRRKDRSTFPVEIVSTYIKFQDKEYINGFARDITERKKAEEAIKESETRYSTIFEQSPIGMEFYRHDGLLLKVNSSCLDIFGIIDPEEIKNWNLFNDPNVTSELKERLLKGESIKFQVDFVILRSLKN